MNSVVIYLSRYGNTRKIAEAIAEGLRPFGTTQLSAAEDALTRFPEGSELVVIGGPTEAHGMTKALAGVFDHMAPDALAGVMAATFDTRLRWPRWLAGSAGVGAWTKSQQAGARMIAPAESFFVKNAEKGEAPKLEPGELERATQWAASLAEAAHSTQAATAAR
ncbi:MAG TPA: flavodoxin domain-containing protein [Ktedonobacterales bacterium]|jgi:flavodoxin|nr:flavodoxin domain-containing protein [Ktedonobacterales bacterium]